MGLVGPIVRIAHFYVLGQKLLPSNYTLISISNVNCISLDVFKQHLATDFQLSENFHYDKDSPHKVSILGPKKSYLSIELNTLIFIGQIFQEKVNK